MHAVSLTPHAQYHWHRMHQRIFEQLRKVKITCKTAMLCKRIKNACGVIDTACTIFSFENRSFGEFEAEFKKALARESGAQGVLFWWKNRGSKISRHCPFKCGFSLLAALKWWIRKPFDTHQDLIRISEARKDTHPISKIFFPPSHLQLHCCTHCPHSWTQPNRIFYI
jgi:hypothetical protein